MKIITIGAVAGGLAGILYKEQGIPEFWIEQLVKGKEIRDLAVRLHQKCNHQIQI